MPVEPSSLVEEIDALLAAPGEDDLARLEDVLASGYAQALALEAERWRLERRLGGLALELADGREGAQTDELVALARRMADAAGELSRLRGLLAALKARASAVRAAA